jgi:hypothetical protein
MMLSCGARHLIIIEGIKIKAWAACQSPSSKGI